MTEVAGTNERYGPGDRVRVRDDTPQGHHRTPWFVKGKTGRVLAVCGVFRNPESLAHGGDGQPPQALYRVEFAQSDVWPDYAGPETDSITADVYEHWLEGV